MANIVIHKKLYIACALKLISLPGYVLSTNMAIIEIHIFSVYTID